MRIGALEINWSSKDFSDAPVYHVPPALAKNLHYMTPDELRLALWDILHHLNFGFSPVIPARDPHRRIAFKSFYSTLKRK